MTDSLYLKIDTDGTRSVTRHPNFRWPNPDDPSKPGRLLTDDELANLQPPHLPRYRIIDEQPDYDSETQHPPQVAPIDDWPIEDNRAIKLYTVTDLTQEELDERERQRQAAQDSLEREVSLTVIAEVTARRLVKDTELSEDERRRMIGVYPRWEPGQEVIPGDMRRHNEALYECIQGHTTQADWQPQDTPALWNEVVPSGVIPEWSQPAGAHDAYPLGAKVTHAGQTWISTVDNNVWEPGVFGWTPT